MRSDHLEDLGVDGRIIEKELGEGINKCSVLTSIKLIRFYLNNEIG
jgi:hypothetical protein